MTNNGTMGMAVAIQSDGADAATGVPPALQFAQARTTPAMSPIPGTTSSGKGVGVSHRLTNLGSRFMEDITVISL